METATEDFEDINSNELDPPKTPVGEPDAEAVKGYIAGIPIRLQRTLSEAIQIDKPSLRSAISAKCHSCVGYEDTTDRIRYCTIWRCPLWRVRPYRKNRGKVSDVADE